MDATFISSSAYAASARNDDASCDDLVSMDADADASGEDDALLALLGYKQGNIARPCPQDYQILVKVHHLTLD